MSIQTDTNPAGMPKACTAGMPTRKTDEEIRHEIINLQAGIDDMTDNGGVCSQDWCASITAVRWLKWTLGE